MGRERGREGWTASRWRAFPTRKSSCFGSITRLLLVEVQAAVQLVEVQAAVRRHKRNVPNRAQQRHGSHEPLAVSGDPLRDHPFLVERKQIAPKWVASQKNSYLPPLAYGERRDGERGGVVWIEQGGWVEKEVPEEISHLLHSARACWWSVGSERSVKRARCVRAGVGSE